MQTVYRIGNDSLQQYKQLMSFLVDSHSLCVPQIVATVQHRVLSHVKGAFVNLQRFLRRITRTPTSQPATDRGSLENGYIKPSVETISPPSIPVNRSATQITGSSALASLHVNEDFWI